MFKLTSVCQGCDIEQDAIVLKSGERVGASEIGLLAAMGVTMVKVVILLILYFKIWSNSDLWRGYSVQPLVLFFFQKISNVVM